MPETLMNLSELARELDLDRRILWTWSTRRDRNAFPGPADFTEYRGRVIGLWKLTDVKAWHATYDPDDWPNRPRKNTSKARLLKLVDIAS